MLLLAENFTLKVLTRLVYIFEFVCLFSFASAVLVEVCRLRVLLYNGFLLFYRRVFVALLLRFVETLLRTEY